jgi:hypothetical protein
VVSALAYCHRSTTTPFEGGQFDRNPLEDIGTLKIALAAQLLGPRKDDRRGLGAVACAAHPGVDFYGISEIDPHRDL